MVSAIRSQRSNMCVPCFLSRLPAPGSASHHQHGVGKEHACRPGQHHPLFSCPGPPHPPAPHNAFSTATRISPFFLGHRHRLEWARPQLPPRSPLHARPFRLILETTYSLLQMLRPLSTVLRGNRLREWEESLGIFAGKEVHIPFNRSGSFSPLPLWNQGFPSCVEVSRRNLGPFSSTRVDDPAEAREPLPAALGLAPGTA